MSHPPPGVDIRPLEVPAGNLPRTRFTVRRPMVVVAIFEWADNLKKKG